MAMMNLMTKINLRLLEMPSSTTCRKTTLAKHGPSRNSRRRPRARRRRPKRWTAYLNHRTSYSSNWKRNKTFWPQQNRKGETRWRTSRFRFTRSIKSGSEREDPRSMWRVMTSIRHNSSTSMFKQISFTNRCKDILSTFIANPKASSHVLHTALQRLCPTRSIELYPTITRMVTATVLQPTAQVAILSMSKAPRWSWMHRHQAQPFLG